MMFLVSKKKIHAPWFVKLCDGIVTTVGLALFVAIVAGVGKGLYEGGDERGWFSHTRIVTVWMHRNWLAGEFK